MACDLRPIGIGADACTENYAGTGTTAYIFKTEDVDLTGLKVNETKNLYDGFALKTGKKIYPVILKNQANKVDSSSLGANKGFSNVGTIVIEKDLDVAAAVARTVNNSNFGVLLRRSDGNGCFILWNPNVKPTFELADTTGDAFDSDNTATWTITSSPMPYPRMCIGETEFTALTVAESTTGSE